MKVMIAEPKGKRGRRDPLFSEAFAHAIQQPGLEYGTSHLGPYSAMSEPSVRLIGRGRALKRRCQGCFACECCAYVAEAIRHRSDMTRMLQQGTSADCSATE